MNNGDMNRRRASRSAYNYDNDRPYAKGTGQRPRGGDGRRNAPPAGNAQPARQAHGRNMQKQSHPRDVRNVRGQAHTMAQARSQRGAVPHRENVPQRGAQSVPHPQPQRSKQTPVRINQPQRKRPANQPQKKRDWVYPEGYRPQGQTRRPTQTPGRRPAGEDNGRRPARRPRSPKKSFDWERFGAVCLALFGRFAVCLAVVAIVMLLIYRNMFYSNIEPPTKEVDYTFLTVEGEGDEAKTVSRKLTFDAASAYSRGELLVSFSEVSKWLGTAQVGDVYSMRFVLGEGNSDDVVFHNSSRNAFINGAPVVMRSVARFDNGEVWVPVSFITDYLEGVEVMLSEGAVTFSFTGEDVRFNLRPADPLQPAEQPEEE